MWLCPYLTGKVENTAKIPIIWKICVEKIKSGYIFEHQCDLKPLEIATVTSKEFSGQVIFKIY
tara:strand:+ start:189 stop:377 length:189 start_codon:yes stop_codon:yes gene_type:complete